MREDSDFSFIVLALILTVVVLGCLYSCSRQATQLPPIKKQLK